MLRSHSGQTDLCPMCHSPFHRTRLKQWVRIILIAIFRIEPQKVNHFSQRGRCSNPGGLEFARAASEHTSQRKQGSGTSSKASQTQTPSIMAIAMESVIGLWLSKPMGFHFGVGAPPIFVYFTWDWGAHWGYGILTHGHTCFVKRFGI